MEEHNLKSELITTSSKMTSTNKKRKLCYDNMKEHPLLGCNKWEDMDFNILKIIFSLVTPRCDLFWNVSSVCRSWRSACWDYLFWSRNALNLVVATDGLGKVNSMTVESMDVLYLSTQTGFFGKLSEGGLAVKFMKLLRSILEGNDAYGSSLERWTESIINLLIPMDLDISDEHLYYIAERTPGLKYICLLGASKLTSMGVSMAFYYWQDAETVALGPCNVEDVLIIINLIGMRCTELWKLAIHHKEFSLDIIAAYTLAKCIPQVTELEFEGANLCETAMRHLFEKIPLESVIFYDCFLVAPERCLEYEPLAFNIQFKDRSSWTIEADGYQLLLTSPNHSVALSRQIIKWLSIGSSVQIEILPQTRRIFPSFHYETPSYYPIKIQLVEDGF